jgi:hypothetical protein
MMKRVLGLITAIAGLFGMIGSAIAIRFWGLTVVVMSILKLANITVMPWFAGPFTAGAISTGLWMFALGIVFLTFSYVFMGVGAILASE